MKVFKFLCQFVFFSLLLLFIFKTPIAADTNLASNPSFETGENAPIGWETINGVGCTNSNDFSPLSFEWSTDFAKTGFRSIALKDINWSQAADSIPGRWATKDFIAISPLPQEYEISILFNKTENAHIGPSILVCGYDSNGILRSGAGGNTQFPVSGGEWWSHRVRLTSRDSRVSKIKVSLGSHCFYTFPYGSLPCTGSIWFDDIVIRPVGKIKVHKFEDLNTNGIQEVNEPNLETWRFRLFPGQNCEGQYITDGPTNASGDIIFPNPFFGLPLSEYSILETMMYVKRDANGRPFPADARQDGWVNTTPLCQNVTLRELETPVVNFGNIRGPTVPYFSQKDPSWANQEYDHASTIGPFFCGATIAGCGCAITSSAMLLKYHGANKSPDGQDTTPQTLNSWLKVNNGYAFGALKWNSIAAYSVKANQVFGTQKIKFKGNGLANDFSTLNTELINQRPTILAEPGHFILATGIQSPSYSINDPAFQNKTNLSSYANSFTGMRLFEKTNTDLSTIYISTPAPTELFLVDSLGRRVGKDPETGEVYAEIPNSYYTLETQFSDQSFLDPQIPESNLGVNTLVIINPQLDDYTINSSGSQNYPIDFSTYDVNGDISVENFQNLDGHQNFNLEFSPEPGSQIQVAQIVETDIKPGSVTNPINLKASGEIPVAILSTDSFDTTSINPQTVKFGPNSATETHQKGHWEDVDDDGDIDLLLHFKTQDSGLSPPQTEACISGQTLDGIHIIGCDLIHILSP